MIETSEVTAVVLDRGTFFPVATRLARDFKKVYYCVPGGEAYETFAKGCIGAGHEDVELTNDLFKVKSKCNLFIFPDSNLSDIGVQQELESQGLPVWGSKEAAVLEQLRGEWLNLCKELDLPMPKTHKIKGLTNLSIFLHEHEGETHYVKISRWRGDMETWEASDLSKSRNRMDLLAMKFGPFKEQITFYVQEPVETGIEAGADTYFAVGQFPSRVLLGYEKKSEGYFCTWKERDEMPQQVWDLMAAVGPMLAAKGYCNMVTSEVRIKGDKGWWLDPSLRFPSPAGESELELYKNLGDIINSCANGEFREPEMAAKYCGQAMIKYDGDSKEAWKSVVIPEDLKRWVKFYGNAFDGVAYQWPPCCDDVIGSIIWPADTPEAVIDGLKDICEALKDCPVSINLQPLADLFDQIEDAKKDGVPFDEKELPDSAIVL